MHETTFAGFTLTEQDFITPCLYEIHHDPKNFDDPGWQFNRKIFGLSFGLKNNLSFDLRFPTLEKSSKMGGLDMSQNQNGISNRFFKPKLKPTFFLLNCHSESFKPERFLDPKDGSFEPHPGVIPFGVGKRDCLGKSLA